MEDKYYGVQDVDGKNFYQLSKQFFNNPFYQKREKQIRKRDNKEVEIEIISETLTDTAKIMYAIFRDVLSESVKNNWIDSQGHIYIKYSVEKLCKLLGKSKETIIKTKKNLVDNDLLEIVPQGLGKADIFYLKKIKNRPAQIIIEEYREDKSSQENQPVEFSDRYNIPTTTGLVFRPEPVGKTDPNKPINKYINKPTCIQSEKEQNVGGGFLEKIKILLEQHGFAPDVKVRLMTLVREKEISFERVTEVLKIAPTKNWGEGAIYRALENNWDLQFDTEQEEKKKANERAERSYQKSLEESKKLNESKEKIAQEHKEKEQLLEFFNTLPSSKQTELKNKASQIAIEKYGNMTGKIMARTYVIYELLREELKE